MATFLSKIRVERPRKNEKKKKKIFYMSSYLTRNKKFQKTSKIIPKIKKHHYSFFSNQNRLGMAEKERKEKKSFR